MTSNKKVSNKIIESVALSNRSIEIKSKNDRKTPIFLSKSSINGFVLHNQLNLILRFFVKANR